MANGPEGAQWEPLPGEEEIKAIITAPEVKSFSWLERLLTNVAGIFAIAFRSLWDHADILWTNKWLWSKKNLQAYDEKIFTPLLNTLVENFVSLGVIDRKAIDSLRNLKPQTPIFDLVYTLFVSMNLLRNFLETSSKAMGGKYVQTVNKEFRPNLPDPSTVVNAAFIAPEKTGEVREILKRHGLKEEDIDLLFIARYQLYDVQTLKTLYLWKLIDKEKVYERMREMGFTDTRTNEIIQTWAIIPPVQDILTMVAKEAFEPDQIARYGLDLEFPADQSEWLEKQGLNRFWQEKYWAAHWNYPSPQQVLELLHRGIVDKDEVNEYYRVVEMPKFWREKLQEASYNVFTRVDTRRMHGMGVLTDEDLIKAYMDQGYNLERASQLAEFTKRYNADTAKHVTMGQIVKAYRNSMINRTEATDLLKSIKFTPDHAEWLLSNADFEETLELQGLYINALKTRYLDGLINDLEARTELAKLNLPGARIDALMSFWKAQFIKGAKLPSKTDLDKFIKQGIIDKDQYRNEMYRLGYSFQYTDWFLRSTGKT